LGNNGTVNGTPIVVSGTTSLPVTGTTSASSAGALPALSPTTFPAVGTGTLNTTGPVAAGSYGTINASGNPTIFSGGTYYIDKLDATGPIQLAAGTYYINKLKLRANLTVTGAVQLFIGNKFDVKNNGIALNAGGNAGNLQVNLYGGVQFDAGQNNISFTGLIYSPFATSQVQFNSNATITGAVITAGQVQFGNNTTVNYDATVQGQISSVACPVAGPDHVEIQHGGTGLTCSPQTVTLRACADAACTTLYTDGGMTVTPAPGGVAVAIGATGTATTTVQQSTAGGATLSATSSPAAAMTCWDTVSATASCAMTFSNSGFLVTVPNHTSCTNVTATIEAVQSAGPGRCVPAYQNVTRAVNLYTSYANPANGTMAVTVSTGAVSTAAPGTVHNLAFDANGTATMSLSYPDAGQLTLTASGTAPTGAAMAGNGTFVVAPAAFTFSAIPAAPLTAGQTFNATVTAMNACAAATPNFNSAVAITSSNPLPALGNAMPINATAAVFAGGASNMNLIWNEVGTINLNASMSSYLGWTLPAPATGMQANVGRFHPAYFDTVVTPACGTFSYAGTTAPVKAGQPFTVTATAHATGGSVTQNYAGTANAYATTLSNAGVTTGFAANTIPAAGFAGGVGVANGVSYAMPIPETAPVTLTLRATDADTVSSSGHAEGTMELRSGRARLSNVYGSELLDMAVPFSAEYYVAGQGWQTNGADSCTVVTLPALVLQPGGTAVNRTLNSPLLNGAGGLVLLKPSVAGTVDMVATVPVWLQFDWVGAGVSNPAARAIFGVYSGHNSFIYRGRRGR